MILDSVIVEPLEPFVSDELTVSDKAFDAAPAEQADEPRHDINSLLVIGVPRSGSRLNRMGNDMWPYAMPNTNALILSSPNFQLVRSIVSVYGPSRGMRDLRYSATTSKYSTSCAMKRWMRRKRDSLEALLPNAPASLDKQTVSARCRALRVAWKGI